MKKIILILLIIGGTVWFYYWYVRGINLLLNEPEYYPPAYSFATRLPGEKDKGVSVVAWQRAADMPTARTAATAAALNEVVYVIGGIDGLARTTDVVESFDVKGNFWQTAAPLPQPLHHAAAVSVGDRIYVLGGLIGLSSEPVDTVYAYDPSRNEWSQVSQMPKSFGSVAAVALNGQIHLIGGETLIETLNQHLIYDPAANTWSTAAALERGRDRLGAAVMGGKIWIVGGRGGSTLYNESALSVYDPVSLVWDDRLQMNVARSAHAVGATDRLFVVGGESTTAVIGSVEAYDPVNNSWERLQPMPHPRYGTAYAQVGSRLFVIGGSARPTFSVSEINEVYNLPLRSETGIVPPDQGEPVAGDAVADEAPSDSSVPPVDQAY